MKRIVLIIISLVTLYAISYAASTGDTSPTTGTAAGTWANPDSVLASDNERATESSASQDPIEAETFGFSITAGSTIDIITAKVEGNSNGGSPPNRGLDGQLTKDGSSTVGASAAVTLPNGTDAIQTFSPASPLWSTAWTIAEIEATTFGIFISPSTTSTSNEMRVDHITISITFTEPLMSGRRRRIMQTESSPGGTPILKVIGYVEPDIQ